MIKLEKIKEELDLKNITEVFAYCDENLISLKNIQFSLEEISEEQEIKIHELINKSKNNDFKYQSLFILANKLNSPISWENIKPIHALRIAMYEGKIDKSFIYKNEKFLIFLKEAFISSNNVVKEQYLPFIVGKNNAESQEKNAKNIVDIIKNINIHNKEIANDLFDYVKNIATKSFIKNERTILREKIFNQYFDLNILNIDNKQKKRLKT